MDRRHGALLGRLCALGIGLLASAGGSFGKQPEQGPGSGPTPKPTPSATATATPGQVIAPSVPVAPPTPWVQASPPLGAPGPSPAIAPVNRPRAPLSPPLKDPLKNSPPAPPPAATKTPSQDDLRKEMQRRRQEEMKQTQGQDFSQAEEQMSPDERRTFERNLRLWRSLTPEERQALRGQAGERIREETDQAYQDSGLALTDDQREVYLLRYRQERRRVEREIQDRANAERTKRIPEITERLKREFAHISAANAPKPTVSPTPVAGPTSAGSLAISPAPSSTPKL